jgi:MinD superfamily P-loop ATPase
MPELVVLSGKGGTGKTSLVGALAALAGNQVLCDADVDAADLHLLLEPRILEKHDLERIASLVDHFRLPSFVLVNKADLHWPSARAIRRFCDLKGYHFLGYLPFTPSFTQAQVEGKTILEYDSNEQIKLALVGLWEKLRQEIQKQNPS